MQINLGQYTSLATLLLNPSKLYINNEMANNLHMKTLLLCLVTLSCTSMLFYFGSLPHIENTAGSLLKREKLKTLSACWLLFNILLTEALLSVNPG